MSRQFKAKKSLGQNFLTNPKIAEKIAQTVAISAGDTVLEIGPGTGMLTRALLKEGARVVAVEADPRAIEVLEEAFRSEIAAHRLVILLKDIRTTDIADLPLPKDYFVAANIPYYLSGYLFEKLLSGAHQPKTLVFLVQKEVAERIARSTKESLISLSIKAYGAPKYIGTVSRGHFAPQPSVDSAILRVEHISKTAFNGLSEKFFFSVLKAGFRAKRKQLIGNLLEIAPRSTLVRLWHDLGLRPDIRGEDLSLTTWLSLARALQDTPQG